MSVILCRQEPVKHPFYFEDLGVHLYSSQELCYVIYNNPLLVMNDFVDDHLIQFIREELDQVFFSQKLENWKKSDEDPDELLFMILKECDYYTAVEINRFRQQVAAYRKLTPPQFAKAKGDYLFTKGQYGRAAEEYERLLEKPREKGMDDRFVAGLYHNLGSAYACLFLGEKACHAYEKSLNLVKDDRVLKKICYLTSWNPSMPVGDRTRSLITEEMKEQCVKDVKEAENRAENAPKVLQLGQIFCREPDKRLEKAGELVRRWEQEYRGMI